MACDLCSKTGPTTRTRIEGVEYDACSECAKLGTAVTQASLPKKRGPRRNPDEDVSIRGDYSKILRKARGTTTHSDFAKLLRVKESEVHAWETGNRTPTISQARSLEKQLKVTLLTRDQQAGDAAQFSSRDSSSSGALTIGDLLKKK